LIDDLEVWPVLPESGHRRQPLLQQKEAIGFPLGRAQSGG
jgi:hypothetical protein